MAEITVHLSEEMKRFVDRQVQAGGYAGAGEYLVSLLLRAHEGEPQPDSPATEGYDRRGAIPLDDAQWEQIWGEVRSRLGE